MSHEGTDLDGYGMICARRKGNGRKAYTDWSGDYEVATGSGIRDHFFLFIPCYLLFLGKRTADSGEC